MIELLALCTCTRMLTKKPMLNHAYIRNMSDSAGDTLSLPFEANCVVWIELYRYVLLFLIDVLGNTGLHSLKPK